MTRRIRRHHWTHLVVMFRGRRIKKTKRYYRALAEFYETADSDVGHGLMVYLPDAKRPWVIDWMGFDHESYC